MGAALSIYLGGSGDLSDRLIGFRGRAAGVTTTFTFDRSLATSETFTVLSVRR